MSNSYTNLKFLFLLANLYSQPLLALKLGSLDSSLAFYWTDFLVKNRPFVWSRWYWIHCIIFFYSYSLLTFLPAPDFLLQLFLHLQRLLIDIPCIFDNSPIVYLFVFNWSTRYFLVFLSKILYLAQVFFFFLDLFNFLPLV